MRRHTIGWAPRDYHGDHNVDWSEDQAIEELRPLLADGYRLRLIVQSTAPGGDDRPAAERIASKIEAEVIVPSTISEAGDAYAGCALVICQRMHAAIFALQVGTPVLVVGHEPKMAGMLEQVGQPADRMITTADGLGPMVRALMPRLIPPIPADVLDR